ncbi:DUF4007 family protein [Psychrobacter sp. I-STPA10]|uniref:DUF4007 family protein n=1 Tax=Psychrobacter sp. I-STPA10 TaxID=2585769 RepID=UPI001E594F39|nr:DUF4007 family protein [Psychrobacter sp. I-STPA10]
MNYFSSNIDKIKPILSGHDTFPLRYGWIKKVYDQIEMHPDVVNVFSQDTAIANFGVGKNMLNALRFWSTHTAMIIRDGSAYYNTYQTADTQKLAKTDEHSTDEHSIDATRHLNHFYNAQNFFGDHGLDPYLESPSTIWLLHLSLVTNPNLVTYYWFFNINTKSELSREEFVRLLKEFLKDHNFTLPSASTIKRDIECFIQNYTTKPRKANEDFESTLEGPLVELGLLTRVSKQNIRALRGEKNTLTLPVFIYALVSFWQNHHNVADTLSLEMCTYDECSPGRVFMLDEEAIIGYAEQLQDSQYSLAWTQSAGIRQFQITDGNNLHTIFEQCIKHMCHEDYKCQ